jgi:pimeloyl-ACP methyl ester carboxylesterase
VVATDYEGLGTAGVPPYLVGQSEGQGVLDAARAARQLVGRAASNTVVVVGYSQGGQAALFAGQIGEVYAPELYLAGIAAIAPVTSLTQPAPAVPGPGTDPDAGFAVMALASWSQVYRGPPLGSELTGTAVRDAAIVDSACSGTVGARFDTTPSRQVFRPGWSAIPALRSEITINQPGRAPTSAPLLVVQGTEDTVVPYSGTTGFVTGALCRGQHDTVEYEPVTGVGHAGMVATAAPTILQWISSRVAGATPPDSCAPDTGAVRRQGARRG